MEDPIAYCGLNCTECPAYIAKQDDDEKLREKTAEFWSKEFGNFHPEEINCDGCKSDGELLKYCNECPIRSCATSSRLENCGHCADYPCDELAEHHENIKDAKETLDEIHYNIF
ncbi:MAG: DUF3795 domain-containing protein [Candidatus Hadarchaeota archaeon]